MDGSIFLFAGSFLTIAWGIAHLFPTKNVVRGFGEITADNKKIILMEWILEGASLIFIGFMVAIVTYTDRNNPVSRIVYWTSFAALNIFSIISIFTGFKVSFIPFKLCPLIFSVSSILIIAGSFLL
jgi:hypothetical protein